jgi:hypothetical protein
MVRDNRRERTETAMDPEESALWERLRARRRTLHKRKMYRPT